MSDYYKKFVKIHYPWTCQNSVYQAFHLPQVCHKNNGSWCKSVVRGILWVFMGGRQLFSQNVYGKLESFVSCTCRECRSNQILKDVLGTSLIPDIDYAELWWEEQSFEEVAKWK